MQQRERITNRIRSRSRIKTRTRIKSRTCLRLRSGRKVRGGIGEYFQNKILEIFLSPVGFYTRDEDSSALGHGCINEIRKSRYIVYRYDRETARR